MTEIAIERAEEYDASAIKEKLLYMFSLTSFPDVRGKSVLVKPNILSDAPKEKAITTHPEVLRALLEILREKDKVTLVVRHRVNEELHLLEHIVKRIVGTHLPLHQPDANGRLLVDIVLRRRLVVDVVPLQQRGAVF